MSMTFVNGSKIAYDTKKIDSAALYCPVDKPLPLLPRPLIRPEILALPILVLSKKAMR